MSVGVIGSRETHFATIGKHSCISRAEIYTFDRYASFNLVSNYKGQNIAILTESQVAIKAVRSFQVNFKLVWCSARPIGSNALGSRPILVRKQ